MYLVVFRSRKRKDIDAEAYAADSAQMAKLARAQPGFISFKSFEAEDGETVAISEWSSEAAMHAWASHPEHDVIRKRGWDNYYEEYTLYSCNGPRVHHFDRS